MTSSQKKPALLITLKKHSCWVLVLYHHWPGFVSQHIPRIGVRSFQKQQIKIANCKNFMSFAHMENFSEEHEMPSSKRAKFMIQEASAVSIDNSLSATNENSSLGLKLRKSPSLLDLAQLSLSCLKSQENLGYVHTVRSIQEAGEMENRRCAVVPTNSKKATNFSASILRIGSWKNLFRVTSHSNFRWGTVARLVWVWCFD